MANKPRLGYNRLANAFKLLLVFKKQHFSNHKAIFTVKRFGTTRAMLTNNLETSAFLCTWHAHCQQQGLNTRLIKVTLFHLGEGGGGGHLPELEGQSLSSWVSPRHPRRGRRRRGEVRRQAPGWASFHRCYVTWRPHLLYVNGRSRSGWGGLKGSGQLVNVFPLSTPPRAYDDQVDEKLQGKITIVGVYTSRRVSPYFQLSTAAASFPALICSPRGFSSSTSPSSPTPVGVKSARKRRAGPRLLQCGGDNRIQDSLYRQ